MEKVGRGAQENGKLNGIGFYNGKEGRGTHGRPDFNADASSMRPEKATGGHFIKLKKGKGGEGACARDGSALGWGDEWGRLQSKPATAAAAAFKQGGGRTEVGEGEVSARSARRGAGSG